MEYVRENGAKRTPYQRFVFPYIHCLLERQAVCLTNSSKVLTEKCFHAAFMIVILSLNCFLFRRNSKIRMSARSLATDVPKQVSGATRLMHLKLKLSKHCTIMNKLIQFSSSVTFHFLFPPSLPLSFPHIVSELVIQ